MASSETGRAISTRHHYHCLSAAASSFWAALSLLVLLYAVNKFPLASASFLRAHITCSMDVRWPDRTTVVQYIIDNVSQHPLLSLLAIFLATCLTTRILSGIRFHAASAKQSVSSQSPHAVPILPYWIPWLGHGIPFALGGTAYLSEQTRSLGSESSIYALFMANSKHNVVTIPSMARQILLDRHTPISMDSLVYRVMDKFWDDRGTIKAIDHGLLWGTCHPVLVGMLRETFVTTAIKATVEALEERTFNLVSGSESLVDHSIWEREGKVEVISGGRGDRTFTAEASLFPLMRNFVGDIASTVLMGRNFMENNPDILRDLWEMDTRFNLFLAGTPSWFPGMIRPSQARERIIDAVEEHHHALFKYIDGKDPGSRWSDMSDVSSVMVDRATTFRAVGSAPRGYATGDGAILWAMNVNANSVVFWLLWYVYADPSLLEELRHEISPYVKTRTPLNTGLPIEEAPKLEIDIASLWAKCPLLKGAFLETMRIEATGMSYKEIVEDFVVTESEEDARLLGRKDPRSFLLRKGELICIPHGVHQSDDKYFRDPERFDPRRFWKRDKDEAGDDADVRVEYGTMKVWGGGKQMCKGKTFAEREVVLFTAAILMQWDMTVVSDGGKWVHPGRKPGPGVVTPVLDVRVRMTRRGVD